MPSTSLAPGRSKLAPWPVLTDEPGSVNHALTAIIISLCKACRADVARLGGKLPVALSGYPMPPSVLDTHGKVVWPYHVVTTGEALTAGGKVKAVTKVTPCWGNQAWKAIQVCRDRGVL